MEFNYYHIIYLLLIISVPVDIYSVILTGRQAGQKKISPFTALLIKIYLLATVALTMLVLLYPLLLGLPGLDGAKMRCYYSMLGIMFQFHIPKILYQMLLLAGRAVKSKLLNITGIIISVLFFIIILYGTLVWKKDFRVKTITLKFKNLPASFEGTKILHVSDIHLGSFYDYSYIKKAAAIISRQNADIIVFTGDLVNVTYAEAIPYISSFAAIKAPLGKFSILGNHDMNDYRKIDRIKGGFENIKQIINTNRAMGFDILLNESRALVKGNDSISMIGIMNWGKPPFRAYGNLQKAMQNATANSFKILLSHDPSLWSAKVIPETDIDLTLSGHTHGFQFAINTANLRWSPGQFLHKHWLGLYKNNNQYLYVNAGLGFLGVPFRIGIRPEITLIELRRE